MSESILNTTDFIPTFETLGFGFQPTRILMLISLILIIVHYFRGGAKPAKMLLFERFMLAFFAFMVFIFGYHFISGFPFKQSFLNLILWLSFPMVLYALKLTNSEELKKNIYHVIILTALLSTIVGFIQLIGNQDFMRVRTGRIAFGTVQRASGFFEGEYTQSYFCMLAWMITLVELKKGLWRRFLLILFPISMITTFHRASIIIFFAVAVFYFIYYAQYRKTKAQLLFFFLLLFGLPIFVESSMDKLMTNMGQVSERISQNTMTGRMNINEVVLERLPDFFFTGIGSQFTAVYYVDMYRAGEAWASSGETGGVHNLFLNVSYLYGVPAGILMFLFILTIPLGIFPAIKNNRNNFVFFGTGAVFFLANLTNWFYPNTEFSMFLAIILGVGLRDINRSLADARNESNV